MLRNLTHSTSGAGTARNWLAENVSDESANQTFLNLKFQIKPQSCVKLKADKDETQRTPSVTQSFDVLII